MYNVCRKLTIVIIYRERMFSLIKGIGIDIVEMDRIEQASVKNKRFAARVLTELELDRYEKLSTNKRKVEFLAGRFTAKEAFAKANGTGIGSLSFQHIEVISDEAGKPCLSARGYDSDKLFVSISHSKAYATAQVIITL